MIHTSLLEFAVENRVKTSFPTDSPFGAGSSVPRPDAAGATTTGVRSSTANPSVRYLE
jgi:hypothetical protein